MEGTVRKIHPNKYSRNGNIFTRIEFMTDDGKWLKTDICSNYRNYSRWEQVLNAGVGTKVKGLMFRGTSKVEINGDSFPVIIARQTPLIGNLPVKEEEPKIKQESLI